MTERVTDERAAKWRKDAMDHVALTVESETMLDLLADRADAKAKIADLQQRNGACARALIARANSAELGKEKGEGK